MTRRLWYAALAAAVLLALVGQLISTVRHGQGVVNYLSFFTIQSNLLVLATAVAHVRDPDGARSGPWRETVRLAAIVGITVTGVVYAVMIAPHTDPRGVDLLYDVVLHYVSPVMTIAGFLLLDARRRLLPRHLAFMLWPWAWLAYTLLRARLADPRFGRADGTVSAYPYDFLDPTRQAGGWSGVGLAMAAIAVGLTLVAVAYVWLDRRIPALRSASAR